ncbi:hypothetical protein CL8F765_09390 [Escherichia coli]|nr:hypothetical protein CL8F765_09390 [Escherichia coli]
MFKVKTLNAGIKGIFHATLREIDLAQFWRQGLPPERYYAEKKAMRIGTNRLRIKP